MFFGKVLIDPFGQGRIERFKILEIRKVRIGKLAPENYRAALVSTELARKLFCIVTKARARGGGRVFSMRGNGKVAVNMIWMRQLYSGSIDKKSAFNGMKDLNFFRRMALWGALLVLAVWGAGCASGPRELPVLSSVGDLALRR